MSVSRFVQRSRKFRVKAGKIVSSKDPREVNKRSQGKSPTELQGLSKAASRRKGKEDRTTRNADTSCLEAPRSDTTQRSLEQCRARKNVANAQVSFGRHQLVSACAETKYGTTSGTRNSLYHFPLIGVYKNNAKR